MVTLHFWFVGKAVHNHASSALHQTHRMARDLYHIQEYNTTAEKYSLNPSRSLIKIKDKSDLKEAKKEARSDAFSGSLPPP